MPAVVSDTSVLHYLAITGQFHCLHKVFGTVLLPPAVLTEVGRRPDLAVYGQTQTAILEGWMNVVTPHDQVAVQSLRKDLGAGECEAIVLAKELKPSLLLIDDLDGRITAQKLRLQVIGTVGVLLRARKLGHITLLKPLLDDLITHRFRLGTQLYSQALREAGEIQ